MLNTLDGLIALIKGSVIEGSEIIQIEIPESSNYAFAIQINAEQDIEAWELMRSHLDLTKRYPILVYPWVSTPSSWENKVNDQDFFSRWYYKEELFQGKHQSTSPEAIISRSSTFDLEKFLANLPTFEEDGLDVDFEIDCALEETKKRFGYSPEESEIKALIRDGEITSQKELERWIFCWELQNFSYDQVIAPVDLSYLDWFEPQSEKVLLLLPTMSSWDSLAYLHWYGALSFGSEVAISFLKRWHQNHNAELMCHYGTMLQFKVGQLLKTPTEAFELASEQYALAPCTLQLPGISLRDHARSLLSTNQWFLHERP